MKTTLFPIITRSLAVAALACAAHSTASSQSSDALKHSIPPPLTGLQTTGRLGSSVATDGGYVVTGVPYDDTGGTDSGIVKVFDSATGALLFVLNNPSPSSYDHFGYSVAISGSRVVVGAPDDDTGATDAGSAYVYNLSSATPTVPVAVLSYPSPVASDHFGYSVAISGLNVAVGVPDDDAGVTDAGSVYVFNLASATPSVPIATVNHFSRSESDQFGFSVALSGTRLVVGVPGEDTGADDTGRAFVYDLSTATPTAVIATLNNPSPGAGDAFGKSVAIAGTRVVVGAPDDAATATSAGSAYVYDVGSPTPTVPIATLSMPVPVAYDHFGETVAISGARVVVGVPGVSELAYVYDVNSGTPTVPVFTLNNPSPGLGDSYGQAVAVSGPRVVVGAPFDDTSAANAGSAYLYDVSSGTPTVPVATLNSPGPAGGDYFGNAVAVAGSVVVVGAPNDDTGASNSGAVSVYSLVSATPTVPVLTLNNPSPATFDYFGYAVAASGTRVVVGAYGDDIGATDAGRAYVYNLASGTPTVPVLTLNNPSPEVGDNFGYSVAIAGTRVAVGEPYDNTGAYRAEKVHVYDTTSPTPTLPVATLPNPSPANSDYFGKAVAISGTRVVVGVTSDDTGAFEAGIAYVFDLASATPTVPVVTLNNPSPSASDNFGNAVAISGTRVAVGAWNDSTGATGAGSVYVYDLASATPAVPVATLNNPTPTANEHFGSSVAIFATGVVVGRRDESSSGVGNAGAAYHYDVSRATPTVPILTLMKPNAAAADSFGTAVAVDGFTVAVGTPRDDTALADKGYAYVFRRAHHNDRDAYTATAPASAAVFGPTVSVNFTLPEAALPGTVKLVFRNGATNHVLTLAASQETAGAHSFSFAPSNPTASAQIAAAPVIPEGTYSVALSYQDAVGSYAATSNVATGVVIDTAVPQISPPAGGFTPLAVIAGTPLADYRPQAVVFNGSGIVTFTQVPAPGGTTTVGAINVTLTVTGATGPASSTAFTVNAVSAANDTDGDGMNDAAEVKLASLGFNWQVAQPALVNSLLANANDAGLFTSSQIQAMNVGTPLIARNPTTGIFKLTIGVEKSPDLVTPFAPFPMTDPQTLINGAGELEFYFTMPGDAAFFRLQSQ